MAAHADLIVTGDQAFYELKKFKSVKIVSPAAGDTIFTDLNFFSS